MSPDELERAAERWIADYFLARHLIRTRDWVVELEPAADLALRIAALTHDIERNVPGGPRFDPSRAASDEPRYLLEHSIRSAQIVGSWLAENGAPAELRASVERLIMHHEIGGYPQADLLQAADSLSFLEVNGHRPRAWVEEGRCDVASAQAKLDRMRDRITIDAAWPAAVRFHAAATALLRGEGATIPSAAPPHPASFSVSGPAQGDKRRRPSVRRDP